MQLTQPWPSTFYLTCKVKIKVKGRGTGYRPEITSARVPKLPRTIASLPEQFLQPWPFYLAFDLDTCIAFITWWRNFGTISSTTSFDIEFDREGQMPGQSSWLCKLLREASNRLRPFWYTCWRDFWTISGTPSFGLEFDFEGLVQVQGSWLCKLLRVASYAWDHFGIPTSVISGRYPVPRPFDLEGQMQCLRSWLCKLLMDARYRLRPFWYTSWRNFGTISGSPSSDLEFDL